MQLERNPSFVQHLKENHEILLSMQDKALFKSSVSRETPRSLLKREMVLENP